MAHDRGLSRHARPRTRARRDPPGLVAAPGAPAWAGLALLAVLTALAYAPAMRGGYLWDDDAYVTQNQTLRSPDGLRQIWLEPRSTPQYYPVVFTSMWLEYRLWGLNPSGYHAVNLGLHIANAMLLWVVVRRLAVAGAFLAAALFSLHPVHVESVAWITERKDVLSALFALLAVLAWLRFSATRRGRDYALVAVLFVCALLSKTATCTLPLVFLLLSWWRAPRDWRRDVPYALTLLAVGVGAGWITSWRETLGDQTAGAHAPTPLEAPLVAGRALWFYLRMLVWPGELMTIYPRWSIDARHAAAWLPPAAAAAAFAALWLAAPRIGRGPLVAAAAFAAGLAPVLGFVSFDYMRLSFVADHFQYLPSAALIVLGAALLAEGARRLPPAGQRAAPAGAAVLLLVLAAATWREAHKYESAARLWRHLVTQSPGDWHAHFNLGNALVREGRLEDAATHFAEAVRLRPRRTDAVVALAVVLQKLGRLDEAAAQYEAALALRPKRAEAHFNLGAVRLQQQRYDEAATSFERAAELQPDQAGPRQALARVLAAQGREDEALSLLREAVGRDPRHADAQLDLGTTLLRRGDAAGAVPHLRAAVELNPSSARGHTALGTALVSQRRPAEAIPHFETAARLQPDSADVHNNWGVALELLGRRADAAAHYAEALRLDPSRGDVQANLDRVRGR